MFNIQIIVLKDSHLKNINEMKRRGKNRFRHIRRERFQKSYKTNNKDEMKETIFLKFT